MHQHTGRPLRRPVGVGRHPRGERLAWELVIVLVRALGAQRWR